MMKKLIVLAGALLVLTANGVLADLIFWDDGAIRPPIDHLSYKDDTIIIGGMDYYPATSAELKDGGQVYDLQGYHNASITISGGHVSGSVLVSENASLTMSGGLVEAHVTAYLDATVNISGGSIGALTAFDTNGSITMSGGSIEYYLKTEGYSAVAISGGTIGGELQAEYHSTITLDGSNFVVTDLDGKTTKLLSGDALSGLGSFVENGTTDYHTGTITGILANGDVLNNQFEIYNVGSHYTSEGYIQYDPEIIIVPEPATLMLIALGGLALSRRKYRSHA
jgi:hypothetical protein